MSNLVSYQNRFLVPRNTLTKSVAVVIQPNEYDYTGEAAIALTEDALLVCFPNKQYEVIPLQNMRETEVKDLRGITLEMEKYGKPVFLNPRDAWAVVVKHQKIGQYTYTLTFMTFDAANAYAWKRKIDLAISEWDQRLGSSLLAPNSDDD